VVVARNVDIGQTVAASLQAPVLFVIAQDLSKMQVDTNVDEADVGRVQVGQQATFTVDAFPGRTFRGAITQVRKAAQILQNVVTYDVVVSADNSDLKLLPGMTANIKVVTDQDGRPAPAPPPTPRPAAEEASRAGCGCWAMTPSRARWPCSSVSATARAPKCSRDRSRSRAKSSSARADRATGTAGREASPACASEA
jgi:hypothetical protein